MRNNLYLISMGAMILFTAAHKPTAIFTQGVITYTLKVTTQATDEETKAAVGMMPTEVTMKLKGNSMRMDMNMTIGKMSMITKDGIGYTMLMDMNGQKIAMKGTEAELDKMQQKNQESVTFTATTETKQLLGYTCKKYIGTSTRDGKTTTLEVWATKDIQAPNQLTASKYKGLDGLLMEFDMSDGPINLHYLVKSIAPTAVGDAEFTIPAGYRLMPIPRGR